LENFNSSQKYGSYENLLLPFPLETVNRLLLIYDLNTLYSLKSSADTLLHNS